MQKLHPQQKEGVHYVRGMRITCQIDSVREDHKNILTFHILFFLFFIWRYQHIGIQKFSVVIPSMGQAGLGSETQPHYKTSGNLQIREVTVTCSKLALGQLIQNQVMGSASDKILKIYIYIKSSSLCTLFYIFIRKLGLILKLAQKN